MSKKHFIALADMLIATRPDPEAHPTERVNPNKYMGKLEQWTRDRDALADFCRSQNSQFNRERWLGYIAGENGPSGGTVKGGKS